MTRESDTIRWFMVIALLMLPGCATLGGRTPHEAVRVPVALQPLFAACTPSDGSVQMSLTGGGINLSNIEMVWNTPSDAEWDIQFNSVLGETQMEIKRRRQDFDVRGGPDVVMKREPNGALIINDARLPLLDTEIPCLLSGRWPVSWLNLLDVKATSPGRALHRLEGGDHLRSIEIQSNISSGARSVDSCANIEWGGFFGLFRHASNVCLKRWSGGYSVDLKGPSKYQLKWATDNELKSQ